MPVVAGARAALRRRLDGTAIEDDRSRLGHPPLGFPQQHAQIVRHRLEDAGRQPASGLLIDRFPRREVGRQQRQGEPARTIQRKALKTSRRS